MGVESRCVVRRDSRRRRGVSRLAPASNVRIRIRGERPARPPAGGPRRRRCGLHRGSTRRGSVPHAPLARHRPRRRDLVPRGPARRAHDGGAARLSRDGDSAAGHPRQRHHAPAAARGVADRRVDPGARRRSRLPRRQRPRAAVDDAGGRRSVQRTAVARLAGRHGRPVRMGDPRVRGTPRRARRALRARRDRRERSPHCGDRSRVRKLRSARRVRRDARVDGVGDVRRVGCAARGDRARMDADRRAGHKRRHAGCPVRGRLRRSKGAGMTAARALVVAALLVATSAFTASRTTPPPKPAALDALPFAIGGWRGTAAPPLDAATRRELAADAYVTRTYTAAGAPPVGLYVAYYAQQRPNVSIHSPLHCLPGTGWEPLDVSTVDLTATGAPVAARRMLVRKNLDRAVVYYWYVIHGRVVANEIASKWY